MKILETERLVVRPVTLEDAEFILGLLNEPSWLRFIGDKNVRTLNDARNYILTGPLASYERFGFGLAMTVQKSDGARIGLCGLLKRDTLPDVDIGFAMLPAHWGKGYALEAARAVMEDGRTAHGLRRIVAVTNPENARSIQLLAKLGMKREGTVRISDAGPDLNYFGIHLDQPGAALAGHMSDLLVRELEGLRREIALFPDDAAIWRTVPGVANSAANLALHVAGNLQHFVGRVLGGTSYARNREREFGRTSGTKDDVIRELQRATTVVRVTLARMSDAQLAAEFPEHHAGMRFQTDRFLLHLCTHAAFHLGQAGIVRRAVTGDATSSRPIPLDAVSLRG